MIKPEKRSSKDYERLGTNDFLNASIDEVQHEPEHKFKFADPKTGVTTVTVCPGVRFKFTVDGYEFHHYSRWMKLNYGEKSNLFNKYLLPLVEGAVPDMDFDLELLTGLQVKTLWAEKNGFQNIETIRPRIQKLMSASPKPNGGEIAEALEVVEE
jgi:hypothetical protein